MVRNYEPPPEEIEAMCREIQKEWSEHEREERRVFKTAVISRDHRVVSGGPRVRVGQRITELLGQDA
jgi:hypothetical protein